MARKSVVSLEKDVERGVVTVTVEGFAPLVTDVGAWMRAACNPEHPDRERAGAMLVQAAVHGVGQKKVDAAAISRDTANGASATPAEKYEAIAAVHGRLQAYEWTAPRTGGGGEGSLLLRALVSLYPEKSAENLREWLDGKTPKQQAKLRRVPEIAAAIEAIRGPAEAADELVAELREIGEGDAD